MENKSIDSMITNYRVWDKETRQFTYVKIWELTEKYFTEDKYVTQSCTNAEDSNNIKVYQGDILKITWWNVTEYYQVVWNPKLCGFKFGDIPMACVYNSPYNGQLADETFIVGNIFDKDLYRQIENKGNGYDKEK